MRILVFNPSWSMQSTMCMVRGSILNRCSGLKRQQTHTETQTRSVQQGFQLFELEWMKTSMGQTQLQLLHIEQQQKENLVWICLLYRNIANSKLGSLNVPWTIWLWQGCRKSEKAAQPYTNWCARQTLGTCSWGHVLEAERCIHAYCGCSQMKVVF